MTRKPTKTSSARPETTETTQEAGLEKIVELDAEAIHAFDEIAQSFVEGLEAYHEEAIRFVGHRLQQDFAMPGKMMACWSPQEAFGVYADFVQTARKDYLEEAERLARIGADLAEATFARVEMETSGALKAPESRPRN